MEATLTDFRKATTGAKRTQDGPLVRFTVDGVLVAYSKFENGKWLRFVV